jgi:hypothetical protein
MYGISLGSRCQVAFHLGQNKLGRGSYPLDWAITPFESLYYVIDNGFRNFFDESNIQACDILVPGYFVVLNTEYNITFIHDFKDKEEFSKDFLGVKEKYRRRIARFYAATDSDEHIYFVRHKDIKKDQALSLNHLLQKKFPKMRYTLLVIDETDEIKENWKIPHVLNCFMKTAEEGNALDPSYQNNWSELFRNVESQRKRQFRLMGRLHRAFCQSLTK